MSKLTATKLVRAYINRSNDSQFRASAITTGIIGKKCNIPKPLLNKILLMNRPVSIQKIITKYMGIEYLSEILDYYGTDFETEKRAIIDILENGYEAPVDSSQGIKYMLKQYLDIDSNMTNIEELNEDNFRNMIFNILRVHKKMPSKTLNELTSVINENFVKIYDAYDILGKTDEEIQGIETIENIFLSTRNLKLVPRTLFNAKNATRINFAGNELSSLPLEITNMSRLTILVLNINHFTSLPDQIEKLGNLKELYLQSNRLTSLPAGLQNLELLERLNILENENLGDFSDKFYTIREQVMEILDQMNEAKLLT